MGDSLIQSVRFKLEKEILQIERRTDLTDQQKSDKIIVIFSVACGAIAVQPIPFADIFILTPIQAYMGTRLAAIRGMKLSDQESTEIIKQLMGVVGMGLLAQQLGIAAAKVLFPIFGGVATIPVVFGLTYAVGTVMDKYLIAKVNGRTLSTKEIKEIWSQAKKAGKAEGKRREGEIRQKAGNR